MSLQREVAGLLRTASWHRRDPREIQALCEAATMAEAQEPLDQVARRLPYMRYAKGITMALGWAAEAMETKDEAWREDCLREFAHYRDYYLDLT